MNSLKVIEKLLFMSNETWKKHGNPASVFSRLLVFPLLILTIWWRETLAEFFWVIFIVLLVFLFLSTRLFPAPKNNKSWASKSILGEKLWLDNTNCQVPQKHSYAATLIISGQFISLLLIVLGLVYTVQSMVWTGTSTFLVLKLWFLDRMVWLLSDMS
ncbi:DUF6653 family protein [Alteromonas sediminis]|uniref:DUF6653 family protein n=1 Tax=Alteromonas sediminis TaxID=2259342 RepID=UPI0026943068